MANRNYIPIVILFLLSGCMTPRMYPDLGRMPSLSDQCEILAQKRLHVDRHSFKKVKGKVLEVRGTRKNITPSNGENATYTALSEKEESNMYSGLQQPFTKPAFSDEPLSEPRETAITPTLPTLLAEKNETKGRVTNEPLPGRPPDVKAEETNNQMDSNSFTYGIAASGILAMLLMAYYSKRSRSISSWASRNPWKARGLIVAAQTGTAFGAFVVGDQLASNGVIVGDASRYAGLTLFLASASFYPFRRAATSLGESRYIRRKLHDITLFTSGALMLLYLGNHYSVVPHIKTSDEKAVYTLAGFSDQGSISIVKKEVPASEQQDPPQNKRTGLKILLTILAVGVFGLVSYGLAALACSIACSGAEGAAAALFIGGEIGLIVLLVLSIRRIFKGKRKKTEAAPKSGMGTSLA